MLRSALGRVDRLARLGTRGRVLGVAIADLDDLQAVFDFDVVAGSIADVGGSAVIIDEATAESFELELGQSFLATALAGPVELQIVAVVALTLPGQPQPAIVGSLDLAEIVGYDGPATVAYVNATSEQAALTEAVGIPTINVLSIDAYVATLGSNLDTILAQ